MSNVKNAIEHALEGNLADMTASLEAAIKDKVLGAIEAKKAEVAQSMFNPVAESVESRDLNGPSHGGVIAYTDTVGNPAIALHNHGHAIHRSISGDNFKHVWDDGENESSHGSLSGAIKSFEKSTGKTVPKEHIDFFNKHDKRKTNEEYEEDVYEAENSTDKPRIRVNNISHVYSTNDPKEVSKFPSPKPQSYSTNDPRAAKLLAKFKKTKSKKESPEKVLMGLKYGKAMPKNEDIEQVDEKLDPSMGAGEYIHDFVHSKNKKFSGKSKEERIKQALGAYYADKRGK